jgi:uncharacterized protein (TIGR03000 family)
MRRSLLLSLVPVIGLLGVLLWPQDAQAQRWRGAGPRIEGQGLDIGGGYYGGYGWNRGYYYPSYGYSNYYPNYGYTYYDNTNYAPANYDNSMQYANYYNQNQAQGQDVIYDRFGQAWDVTWANPQDNQRMIFLEVNVPSDARLWIDNQETQMRGNQRMFASPTVTPGKTYSYNVKAQWKDPNGQDVTRTQTVNVQAGQITPVDLMRGQPVSQPQTNQPQSIQYQGTPEQVNQPQGNPPRTNPPANQQPVNQPQSTPPQQ